MPDNPGGMQLTCATLGAFTKYPAESKLDNPPEGVVAKKFNFFQDDKELFTDITSPYYFLYGCFLALKEGRKAALAHFSISLEISQPLPYALLSYFLNHKKKLPN